MKLVFNPVSGQFDFIREIDQSVSKTLTYNIDGTLDVVTDARGTKTMAYNGDGTLASLTGTGVYKSKAFTYVGGILTEVTVS